MRAGDHGVGVSEAEAEAARVRELLKTRGGAQQERRRPPDLRLVPAALAAWMVVLLGLGLGPVAALAALLVAVLLVAVTALRHLRSRRRERHPPTRGRGRWASSVVAAAGCAAAAGLVVTAHAMSVAGHPLREPAERGAAATVRVVLRDDPRPIRSAGYGSRPGGAAQVLVPVELEWAEVDDGRWDTGGRLLLIAPAEGWSALLPGQAVGAEGLLAPAARSDLTVAVLRVRGPPLDVAVPPWWQDAAGGLRSGLRSAAEVLPPAAAGLLPGLAVGDTSRITPEVEADFRAAGLTHLLAVSGEKARQTDVLRDDIAVPPLEIARLPYWGSRGRRFKSCRPDGVMGGFPRKEGAAHQRFCLRKHGRSAILQRFADDLAARSGGRQITVDWSKSGASCQAGQNGVTFCSSLAVWFRSLQAGSAQYGVGCVFGRPRPSPVSGGGQGVAVCACGLLV